MIRQLILLLFVFMCVEVESQQWIVDYPSYEDEMICFIGGDISGEYNYSVGFKYNQERDVYNPVALCFDKEGAYKDKSYHETIEKGYFCYALGLGDGNAFVVARYGSDVEDDRYEGLWFAIINTDLEVIREKRVELEEPYISYGEAIHALMNDKNEIVVVAQIADDILSVEDYDNSYDYAFYKLSKECDLLKNSYLKNTSYYADISDFTLIPNTNLYAVFGNGMNHNNVESVFYVDDNLDYISTDFIEDLDNYPNLLRPKFMCVDRWFDENVFMMTIQSPSTKGNGKWCPMVLKMDIDMNIIDMLNLEHLDTTCYISQFRSMAYVDTNTIYISTFEFAGMVNDDVPNKASIYLINEELDLLGRKDFEMEHFFNVLYVQPTIDKGCIIQGYIDEGERKRSVICKLSRSDFEMPVNMLEEKVLDMSMYPNPVSSLLRVEMRNYKGKCVNVKVVDMLGRRYLDQDVVMNENVVSLDVTALTNGLYLCHIEYDKGCYLNRVFVKE